MNVLSLFAGIGGLELGLERAGMTTAGQVEIDPYCRSVLARHWPEVPKHDDVRTAPGWWRSEHRPAVDVVAGGFPCQPVSEAGRRDAQQDDRWLWPAMAAVIEEVEPEWVIGENVPGLLTLGLPDVLRDLRRLGYRARVGTVSACSVGAPHMRSRVFILAHTMRVGCHEGGNQHRACRRSETPAQARQRRLSAAERPTGWETEPPLARVANGVPNGVDRIKALGNSVVPRAAEEIGRLIMAHATERAA